MVEEHFGNLVSSILNLGFGMFIKSRKCNARKVFNNNNNNNNGKD
jgi:hypothetical protein